MELECTISIWEIIFLKGDIEGKGICSRLCNLRHRTSDPPPRDILTQPLPAGFRSRACYVRFDGLVWEVGSCIVLTG